MADLERRKAAIAWIAEWHEVTLEQAELISKCDDGTALYWAFDAGAEYEREACAKAADDMAAGGPGHHIAQAIRARK
jgi:hypothetical protein